MAWAASEWPLTVVDGAVHIVLLGGRGPDRGIIRVSCLHATHLYCVHVFAGGLWGGKEGRKKAKKREEKGK